MNRWIKLGVGLLLLAGLLLVVDADKVLSSIVHASPGWFLAALAFAMATNLICAHRWRAIARVLQANMSYPRAISLYGQALAANSVLPGGILGGDLWRALRLSQVSPTGHKDAGPASVFLDRASGFWGLAWVSLAGGLTWVALTPDLDREIRGYLQVHFALLASLLAAPFLLSSVARPMMARMLSAVTIKFLRMTLQMLLKVAAATPLLLRTLPHSLGAQVFTQLALWSCLNAVGLDVPPLLLVGVSSGILLASVIPAAVGGFGPRELGAAAFLSPFGFPPEALIAGSILFGLTATLQGAMSLLFFGLPEPIDPQEPRPDRTLET